MQATTSIKTENMEVTFYLYYTWVATASKRSHYAAKGDHKNYDLKLGIGLSFFN